MIAATYDSEHKMRQIKDNFLSPLGKTAKKHIKAITTLGLCITMICGIQLNTAHAQEETKSHYGPWSIVCDTPPGAPAEQCALMQNVVAQDRKEVGLSVIVLKTADKKERILRVLAPLGVLLTNGLGLNIDGENIGRTAFVRCVQDGCYAEVLLEGKILESFRKGSNAVFIIFQTPEEGIGIPVDLSGFSEGFKNLP
jgi:invasion protein IalB